MDTPARTTPLSASATASKLFRNGVARPYITAMPQLFRARSPWMNAPHTVSHLAASMVKLVLIQMQALACADTPMDLVPSALPPRKDYHGIPTHGGRLEVQIQERAMYISATDATHTAASMMMHTLDPISPWQAKATVTQKVRQQITATTLQLSRPRSPWTNALHTAWGFPTLKALLLWKRRRQGDACADTMMELDPRKLPTRMEYWITRMQVDQLQVQMETQLLFVGHTIGHSAISHSDRWPNQESFQSTNGVSSRPNHKPH
mmetsp:Transcript_21490/g.48568  ORF Transcript_21490/g.48568 Transcript_21490/m.48568 type:complete len:263 (-) Transcript_21490:425-1213(-)